MKSLQLSDFTFPPQMTDEAKIVWSTANGFTQREIKEYFHFGSSKVSRVIHEYNETGEVPESLKSHPPTKLTPDMLLHIHQCISHNAHTTLEEIQKSALENLNVKIATSTISIGCSQMRYHYKPPQKVHLLTNVQKINRVSFAHTLLEMHSKGNIDLNSIIFSDESRFIQGDDRQWVWRRYGERNETAMSRREKFPKSIMIYGAIGIDYKSTLVIVESSIDSDQYMSNILNSGMIDELDSNRGKGMWIFQQDGARCHTSRKTVKWLSSKCRYIKRWPANSPDLNPIENFLGALKEAVYKLKPQNIEQLKEIVIRVWNEFDQTRINNLVKSFYQRLQLIILNNGESIQSQLVRGLCNKNIIVPNCPNAEYWKDVISEICEEEEVLINEGPFSKEEDQIIINCYIKFGAKWSLIAKKLKGRTSIQIKNRFVSHLRKIQFQFT